MDVQGLNVFLTGTMTGLPDNNRAGFDCATEALYAHGAATVTRPVLLDFHGELTADALIDLMDGDLSSALDADVVVVMRGGQEPVLEWVDVLDVETVDFV
jgi:hypothetical protein